MESKAWGNGGGSKVAARGVKVKVITGCSFKAWKNVIVFVAKLGRNRSLINDVTSRIAG